MIAAVPCVVSVPGPAIWQVLVPVGGTLLGAAGGAIVALRTKTLDYARGDRSVRLQLLALLRLSALQLIDAANAVAAAEPAVPTPALAKTVDRAFSGDAAIALRDQASSVYKEVTSADEAARTFQGLADRVDNQRKRILTDFPSEPAERTHMLALRREALGVLLIETRAAARRAVAALDAARMIMGENASLAEALNEPAASPE